MFCIVDISDGKEEFGPLFTLMAYRSSNEEFMILRYDYLVSRPKLLINCVKS